jgi:hypothetical protein
MSGGASADPPQSHRRPGVNAAGNSTARREVSKTKVPSLVAAMGIAIPFSRRARLYLPKRGRHFIFRHFEVITGPHIHPDASRCPEIAREAQSRICGNQGLLRRDQLDAVRGTPMALASR